MKAISILVLLLPGMLGANAQLTVTPGTLFTVSGTEVLTLQNENLSNNGHFQSGNSVLHLSGNTNSTISGAEPFRFFEMQIAKSNGRSVLLQRSISVSKQVNFISGFLDLNGFDLNLDSTALLEAEQESARIVGDNGGEVVFTSSLQSSVAVNPGNLGILISTPDDLGITTIRRGHQSQTVNPGAGKSVLRYYDLIPSNPVDHPDALLRFRYFDGELNGLNENTLEIFQQDNATTWSETGSTTRDEAVNFVEKANINNFHRLTLSNPTTVLPLNFLSFHLTCRDNRSLLSWSVAQDPNNSHFTIEKSVDGVKWQGIGTVQAEDNSSGTSVYTFTTNEPTQNGFYRIAGADKAGNVRYTGILWSSCGQEDDLRVFPNPVRGTAYLTVISAHESQINIRLVDSKGAVVLRKKDNLQQGSNPFSIDLSPLARGIYQLEADWNNGLTTKRLRIVKF